VGEPLGGAETLHAHALFTGCLLRPYVVYRESVCCRTVTRARWRVLRLLITAGSRRLAAIDRTGIGIDGIAVLTTTWGVTPQRPLICTERVRGVRNRAWRKRTCDRGDDVTVPHRDIDTAVCC
jgi:hypothetical protein